MSISSAKDSCILCTASETSSHHTLAESAALQQAKHSRLELKEVEVVTGEEDESNVFQVTWVSDVVAQFGTHFSYCMNTSGVVTESRLAPVLAMTCTYTFRIDTQLSSTDYKTTIQKMQKFNKWLPILGHVTCFDILGSSISRKWVTLTLTLSQKWVKARDFEFYWRIHRPVYKPKNAKVGLKGPGLSCDLFLIVFTARAMLERY